MSRNYRKIRNVAKACGVKFGTAFNIYDHADAPYRTFVEGEVNIMTPDSELKMYALQPTQGVFDFTDADTLYNWGVANNIAMRFHTLVWHNAQPAWAAAAIASDWRAVMDAHIAGVAGRYNCPSMDVANEVVANDGSGWRASNWYAAAGSIDYVRRAFEKARIYAPAGCKLMLCEFDLEYGSYAAAKSAKVLELVDLLKADGTIDGVTIQSHLVINPRGARLNLTNLGQFFDYVKGLGLVTNIVEMDAENYNYNYTAQAFRRESAAACKAIVDLWLSKKAGDELVLWSFKEDRSWLVAAHDGDETQYAGVVDANYYKNPLYYQLRKAFQNAIAT